MSRVVAELTLEPGTRLQTLPASVPPEVIRYARGMFQTTRDSLRFLWRHDDTWLSVHLVRTRYDPESAAAVRRSSAIESQRHEGKTEWHWQICCTKMRLSPV